MYLPMSDRIQPPPLSVLLGRHFSQSHSLDKHPTPQNVEGLPSPNSGEVWAHSSDDIPGSWVGLTLLSWSCQDGGITLSLMRISMGLLPHSMRTSSLACPGTA